MQIIKPKCPVLIGGSINDYYCVENYAKELESPFYWMEETQWSFREINMNMVRKAVDILNREHGMNLKIREEILRMNLPGWIEWVP